MNTAQPIRSEQELKDFMNFYEQVQYHPRNQLLLTMGLNTALRISDLLSLQWKQVYDLENRSVREHLLLVEAKTGKASNIYLNEKITVQLQKYYQFLASGRSFKISGMRIFSVEKTQIQSQGYRLTGLSAGRQKTAV